MEIKAPKNEIAMVSYFHKTGKPMFLLTTNRQKDTFRLYRIGNGELLEKLGAGKSPKDLEEKFQVNQALTSKLLQEG